MDRSKIVAMANEFRHRMDGTTEPIKEAMAENDIVFGVWQDATEPDGVGIHVIKGHRRVVEIASGTAAAEVKVTAIPCECAEQAVAAQRILGEPDWTN